MKNGVLSSGGFFIPWRNVLENKEALFKSKMKRELGLFIRKPWVILFRALTVVSTTKNGLQEIHLSYLRTTVNGMDMPVHGSGHSMKT
jgi:hypothetical protein